MSLKNKQAEKVHIAEVAGKPAVPGIADKSLLIL